MTFGEKVIRFNRSLKTDFIVPENVSVLQPFADPSVRNISEIFYRKFYNDENERRFIIGINPGRFGAGVTGIPFTDPVRLERECGIPNGYEKKPELSSVYVYDVINACGGVAKFYRSFYVTAVCPLGFTSDGKNMNYYDDPGLTNALMPFIVRQMKKQIAFGCDKAVAICLGEGKNYAFLEKLNAAYGFFGRIIPLPHPRFILQYRRKQAKEYVDKYVKALYEK